MPEQLIVPNQQQEGQVTKAYAVTPVDIQTVPVPFANDPFFAVSVTTYIIVFGVSFLAGLVRFIRKLNEATEPQPLAKIMLRFAGEQVVATFAGLLTFWICLYLGWSMTVTVVMISISAHMGGKAIDTYTDLREVWIEAQKRKFK